MFAGIKGYFAGAKQEFRTIHWPNFAETRRLTLIVIAMSLIVAFFLGIFDFLFTYLLGKVLI